MIIYEPLWRTMKEKEISQYRLIHTYGFSRGQLSRLKQNKYVSTHTIGTLCTILNCTVSDIMEFHMDNSENVFPTSELFRLHAKQLQALPEAPGVSLRPSQDADGESTAKQL